MSARAAYDELIRRTREDALLSSCADVLAWDEDTYLPPGGAAHRAEQLALLAGLLHDRATDPRLADLLAACEGAGLARAPDSPEAVNLRELRRARDREARLPRPLVEEYARLTALAQQEWAAARRAADWPRFRPWLVRVVALAREEAAAVAPGGDPYDALLENYELGVTGRQLADLFAALRGELTALAAALAGPAVSAPPLAGEFPARRQRAFARRAAVAVGFDFARGRIDRAVHPFSIALGPDDCRLATRAGPERFDAAFFTMLHEVGHGLYEQGLPREHHGTPLGEPASLGVHESQARLWENAVGRGRPFWQHFYPRARRAFAAALRGVKRERFLRAVNRVAPGPTRADADEVTYNLHVLVRFELERALVAGDLAAADLPGAWAEKYRLHLGVTPPDDAAGCLQDGHWASGMFGYFPTYTLGNVFAAQLFARAAADLGCLDRDLSCGRFGGLLGWLRVRVHRHGARYPAADLIERATGAPPDHRPLLDGLRQKYGELYGV
jgi:carboxypeptidase Taq